MTLGRVLFMLMGASVAAYAVLLVVVRRRMKAAIKKMGDGHLLSKESLSEDYRRWS